MARLKEVYVNEVAPQMMKKFGYKSVMQIPKLDKVVTPIVWWRHIPMNARQRQGRR